MKKNPSKCYSKIHIFWIFLLSFAIGNPKAKGQAINLGLAGRYAILSGDSSISVNQVNCLGKIGGKKFTSTYFQRADSIIWDTNQINAAITSLAISQNYFLGFSGSNITKDSLGDTTLNPGVYSFSSSVKLMGILRLTNPNLPYIFNVANNLSLSPGFKIFIGNSNASNIIFNIQGNLNIESQCQPAGIFLVKNDVIVSDIFAYNLGILAQGKIKFLGDVSGNFSSKNKISQVVHLPCTGLPEFCELIVDGNFESAVPDQTFCTGVGASGVHTVCNLAQSAIRWTCCLAPTSHSFKGNEILPYNFAIPEPPPIPQVFFPDPNPNCNFYASLFGSYSNPANDYITTLTQPLARSTTGGRFRIRFSYKISGPTNGLPQAQRVHILAGIVPTNWDCLVRDEFLNIFGGEPDRFVNLALDVNPADPTDPVYNQWNQFCGEILIPNDDWDNFCFGNTFSINLFYPNFDPNGYFLQLDNVSIRSLQPCPTIQIPTICLTLGTSVNLNTYSIFAPGVPTGTTAQWFLVNGNNETLLTGGIFAPPGPGVYTIRYRINVNNGSFSTCPYQEDILVTVLNQAAANAGPDQDICISNGRILLNGSPAGGTWTGPGVEQDGPNWYFNPGLAGALLGGQANILTYSLGQTGTDCAAQDQMVVKVWGIAGNLGLSKRVCIGEPVQVQFQGQASPDALFAWFTDGSTATFTSTPFLDPNFTPDPAPYTVYTITPTSAGTITISVQVKDNNPLIPPALDGCLSTYEGLNIEVIENNPSVGCCAHTPMVNEGPNVVVNPFALPGELARGELGQPGSITQITCPEGETMFFDGKYLVNGSLQLSADMGGGATFVIREGSELLINTLEGELYYNVSTCLSPSRGGRATWNRIQIYVDPGVTLIMEGCTLKAACDQMWRGIDVPQGASLVANQGPTGRRNRIEDAILGIGGHNSCDPFDPYMAYNAILQVNRTDFVNCMIGIGDYGRAGTSTQPASIINHCSFSSLPSQMKRPFLANSFGANDYYYGLAGIELNSFQIKPAASIGIHIQNCTFNNLMLGIIAPKSNLNLADCNFDFCYRAAIAKSTYTLGFPTDNNLNNFNLERVKINVPGVPLVNNASLSSAPFSISPAAFSLTANQTSYGIRTYKANINLSQYQNPAPGNFTYYIRGDLNRPANRKAVGILVELLDNQGVNIQDNYFYNFTEALTFTRRQETVGNLAPSLLENNYFEDNKTALSFAYSGNNSFASTTTGLTIKGNRFSGNQTSIDLDAPASTTYPATTDLTLKCNRFDRGNSSFGGTYIGIRLSNAHRLLNDAIGGNGSLSNNKSPGANIWPISGNPNRATPPCILYNVELNCTNGWQSPASWQSVQNNTGNPISIWRYMNEFVGLVAGSTTKNMFTQRCYTDKNDLQTIQPGDVQECGSGLSDNGVVVFPTRMAVDSSQILTSMEAEKEAFATSFLGQNQPNPGQDEVEIAYRLPEGTKEAKISVFSLAGNTTFFQFPLSNPSGSLRFSVDRLPAGIYAYSLVAGGQSLKTKKLVVIK